MTYWSRSRNELWTKGETSGHFQYVKSLTVDCDYDTMLAKVAQVGAACHTGRYSCFFNTVLETVSNAGESIAKIAEGVSAFAMLSIPTKWKNGKPIEFKPMDKDEFTLAADNIKTIVKSDKELVEVYELMKKEIDEGHQVYVVSPLIEESDVVDLTTVNEIKRNIDFKWFIVGSSYDHW